MTVCGIKHADGVCVMGECPYVKMCCPTVWDKSGEPMTNEEYLRSLNTEQLAEWLVDVTQYCFECGINLKNCGNCPFGKCIDKGCAMEWLKQPHQGGK